MAPDIQYIAHEVKAKIDRDTAEGGGFLMDFADTYAVTRRLRHTALILKLNYAKAAFDTEKERLKSEMLDLVDAIVDDHQHHAQTETARKSQAALKRVKDYFLAVKPPREIVFACDGLGKSYKKRGFSLKGVSLTLRLGEITGVVGENANGKTTLAYCGGITP